MKSKPEEPIFFKSGDGIDLEGAFFKGSDKASLIAHPHPVYGGNMNNMVVRELAVLYQQYEWSTLRFNFRGTGKSGGSHSKGINEIRDIRGAARYLKEMGAHSIDLAGYSFGAWVLAHTDITDLQPARILLVSPPAAMMDFSNALSSGSIKMVVTGSEDAIAPPSLARQVLTKLNPKGQLKVIKGADHFFSNRLAELKATVEELLRI